MGWIECVRCEKLQRDFVARTFALIAPVHPVLHQVSWSCETIPNKPKHYATHQNMCLGFNGLDRVRSLQKITTWLRGTKFCINFTSSPRFAPSFMQLWNDPKCTQTLRNAPKHGLGSNGVDQVHSFRKIPTRLRGTNFCINYTSPAPFCTKFRAIMKRSRMHPNTTKRTKTWV